MPHYKQKLYPRLYIADMLQDKAHQLLTLASSQNFPRHLIYAVTLPRLLSNCSVSVPIMSSTGNVINCCFVRRTKRVNHCKSHRRGLYLAKMTSHVSLISTHQTFAVSLMSELRSWMAVHGFQRRVVRRTKRVNHCKS